MTEKLSLGVSLLLQVTKELQVNAKFLQAD